MTVVSEIHQVGAKVEYDGQPSTITYWDAPRSCQQRWTHITKSGGTIDQHEDCQNYEIELASGGFRRVWTCQLHTAPTAPVEPRTPDSPDFPKVGDTLPWTAPDGRTTVVVQRIDFAYTVTVAVGGRRIDDQCGSYRTETEARLIARGYAQMYRAEQTATATVTPISSVGRSVARGHQTDMSQPQAKAIAYVMRTPNQHSQLGVLGRGSREGCLTDPQLRALAKRGYITLAYRANGHQISGARVLPAGERRATEILTTNERTKMVTIPGQWIIAPETTAPITGTVLARVKTALLIDGSGKELAYIAERSDGTGNYDAIAKVGPHTFGNRTGLVAAGVSRDDAIRAVTSAVAV